MVNHHIPEAELSELKGKLEQRDKYQKEIQVYKKRIAYLEKLLQMPGRRVEIKK